jgi:hypothetical protein
VDHGGADRPAPFAGEVFRWRAVPEGPKPAALAEAEFRDAILTRYPGYTLGSLLREDAHLLHQHFGLLDPHLGEAREPDG